MPDRKSLCHPFDRSGLAALFNFQTREWLELFAMMEREQTAFLKEETRFRSGQYKWPRDPLHTWSRCWEYPYVYHHIQKWRNSMAGKSMLKIVDMGSGVTFFPFTVARLGLEVSCTDIDPVCDKELKAALSIISCLPGSLDFRLSNGIDLPYADAEVDAIYSISVLEHIPRFERTIEEMARILKPGGVLFLTIDIDLREDYGMGVERYRLLEKVLEERFECLFPMRTAHPADLLTSFNGPYPVQTLDGWRRGWFRVKQEIKHFLGRPRITLSPSYLCVEGMVMSRRP